MYSIEISPRALQDLEEIWLYTFKTWSYPQADRYVAVFEEKFLLLSKENIKGQRVDYIKSGYYRILIKQHFVFYTQSSTTITVQRILHTKRNIGRHL